MQQQVFLLRLQETKSTIAQAKYPSTLSTEAEAEVQKRFQDVCQLIVHMKKSKLNCTKIIELPTEAQHEIESFAVKQKRLQTRK